MPWVKLSQKERDDYRHISRRGTVHTRDMSREELQIWRREQRLERKKEYDERRRRAGEELKQKNSSKPQPHSNSFFWLLVIVVVMVYLYIRYYR
ncbi:hypothetical protein HYU19_00045 [Candidatus Woesearchaeota archaeon]|nr:hypothetical protein [Candidatus Woesearchaeota archaeon]